MWDEEYFSMEVQAYIQIDELGSGNFQFGLVIGDLDSIYQKNIQIINNPLSQIEAAHSYGSWSGQIIISDDFE